MFFASSHGPCLFLIRTVWAAVAPSAEGWWPAIQRLLEGAVPTPSANAPETKCDIAACVPISCHRGNGVVKRALPTASTALLRSAKQPARRFGSTLPPNRRTGFGLRSPWITPAKQNVATKPARRSIGRTNYTTASSKISLLAAGFLKRTARKRPA